MERRGVIFIVALLTVCDASAPETTPLDACSSAGSCEQGNTLFQKALLTKKEMQSDLTGVEFSQSLTTDAKFRQYLHSAAASLSPGPTKELLQAFEVCGQCNEFKRLGEANDGGYLVCWDNMTNKDIKAAFSMGVEHHDKWSEDIYALLNIPVHQFDCTVDGPANPCGDCHFYGVCIQGAGNGGAFPGKDNYDMSQAVEHTGLSTSAEHSLIMKMDIEGSEWPILAEGGVNWKQFDQLIIEFHGLEDESNHELYVKALSELSRNGFRVAHIHGNNFQGMYEKEGFLIPRVIEATFLSRSQALPACQHTQSFHVLDTPNSPLSSELPPAELP